MPHVKDHTTQHSPLFCQRLQARRHSSETREGKQHNPIKGRRETRAHEGEQEGMQQLAVDDARTAKRAPFLFPSPGYPADKLAGPSDEQLRSSHYAKENTGESAGYANFGSRRRQDGESCNVSGQSRTDTSPPTLWQKRRKCAGSEKERGRGERWEHV